MPDLESLYARQAGRVLRKMHGGDGEQDALVKIRTVTFSDRKSRTMPRPILDANLRHPITLPDGSQHAGTVHLNQVIDHPNIAIGDYSYYSGFETPADYAAALAPYLYPGAPERLTIGRFFDLSICRLQSRADWRLCRCGRQPAGYRDRQ